MDSTAQAPRLEVVPSLSEIIAAAAHRKDGNTIPIYAELPTAGDPISAFLKLRSTATSKQSFLFEVSERTTLKTAFSVIGVEPWKVVESGGTDPSRQGDPLVHLEKDIASIKVLPQYQLEPKIVNGGAFGYVSYDCVRYFEQKVDQYPQINALGLPESVFMLFSSFVVFDHKNMTIRVVALCPLSEETADDEKISHSYELAKERIQNLISRLRHSDAVEFDDPDPTTCVTL